MQTFRLVLGVAVTAGLSTTALAQSYDQPLSPPGMSSPPPPSTGPAAPTPAADNSTDAEPGSDHSFVTPSAMTPRAGTWSFSSYEIVGASLSYSPSDSVQITGATVIAGDFVGSMSAKVRLISSGQTHLALHGGFVTTNNSNDNSYGGAGLAGTYCFSTSCRSRINGYLGVIGNFNAGSDSVTVGSLSGSFELTRGFQAMIEYDTGSNGNSSSNDPGLLTYGARLSASNFSVDLGLVRYYEGGTDRTGNDLPLGLPYIGMTYRGR
jgi:hypothetical protein